MSYSYIKAQYKDPYEVKKHCKGCKYYSEIAGVCDYRQITGRLRSKICGPGKFCTVKELGEKVIVGREITLIYS